MWLLPGKARWYVLFAHFFFFVPFSNLLPGMVDVMSGILAAMLDMRMRPTLLRIVEV